MKWVLIIMMASAADGGVAIQKVDSFTSEKACLTAKDKIPNSVWENNYAVAGKTNSTCIEVK